MTETLTSGTLPSQATQEHLCPVCNTPFVSCNDLNWHFWTAHMDWAEGTQSKLISIGIRACICGKKVDIFQLDQHLADQGGITLHYHAALIGANPNAEKEKKTTGLD